MLPNFKSSFTFCNTGKMCLGGGMHCPSASVFLLWYRWAYWCMSTICRVRYRFLMTKRSDFLERMCLCCFRVRQLQQLCWSRHCQASLRTELTCPSKSPTSSLALYRRSARCRRMAAKIAWHMTCCSKVQQYARVVWCQDLLKPNSITLPGLNQIA